jgi:hypothetical protein
MRVYNIQYRDNSWLTISQVAAHDLEEAKSKVIAKEGLRASQVLKDEAIL